MSTRSLVAAETEKGVVGVYVHWDGYPDGRIEVLRQLAQRDGMAAMVRTIVGKPNGWSSLDPEAATLSIGYHDGRFALVPGYGIEYTNVENQGHTEYWTPETHDPETWAEYLYIIRANGTVDWAPINSDERDITTFDWHTVSLLPEGVSS